MLDVIQSIEDVYLAANFFVWFIENTAEMREHVEGNEALLDAIREEALRIDR